MGGVALYNKENKIKAKSKFVKLGKYRIHYVVAGSGKPIVLLHSAVMGWFQWSEIMPALSENFTVYALDFPGFGESSHLSDLSKIKIFELYPYILKKFIMQKRLKGCAVIGHSLGAWVGLSVKLDNSDLISKLILESPFGIMAEVPKSQRFVTNKYIASILKKIVFRNNIKSLRKFLSSSMFQKSKLAHRHIEYLHKGISKGGLHPLDIIPILTSGGFVRDEYLISQWEMNKLSDIYFLVGNKDPFMTAKKVIHIKRLRKSHLKVFKNVGHVPSIEVPNQYNKAILGILG